MSEKLLYGAAYYAEYMPQDRLEQDMDLLSGAGFDLIRVAESAWSTWEPRDGQFDFSLLLRVLDAAHAHGISVIVGTPTYAIPPWLAKKYPDILSDTHAGPCRYGPRQNFDLTHPGYRFHAERIIRKLAQAVCAHPAVIGWQLDNETKPYDTCSPRAQALFRDWLRERFGTVEALNEEMGLAYWSNSIADWDELPDVRGTINASLGAEYQAFQRRLVTEFLLWQRSILDEYKRPDQFVTHNFDYEWRGYSFGLQPEVDQFAAAQAVDIAGCDIYHPSESGLTGAEIAFGGAMAYALKKAPYLVLETQAQGNLGWLPYPGQLRLQALAHIACGAQGVEYWHWHSIHNAVESYWKGVLSHDMAPGETYREAARIGRELAALSPHLAGMRKKNRAAVMVSTRSQTGLRWFPTCGPSQQPDKNYSDYLRWLCDSLYRLNVEYDVISDGERDFSGYDLVVLPCLYSAPEDLLRTIDSYVQKGGHILATFRTAFADEHLKIYHDAQPHMLTECLGLTYDRFTKPEPGTRLTPRIGISLADAAVTDWMELLRPTSATSLCNYAHPAWSGVPAVTLNDYGAGRAAYLGCCFSPAGLDALLEDLLPQLGVEVGPARFPLIVKRGTAPDGREIIFWLNFSGSVLPVSVPHPAGTFLPEGGAIAADEPFTLPPWGAAVLAEA